MPIRLIASSVTADYSKIEINGRGLYEARVNEEAEFMIDASKALIDDNSKPIIRMTGLQTDIEVRIRQIEKYRHIFLCSYKPTLPGIYLLNIIWSDKELHGSPFKVNVLSNINPNHSSSKVICSGDGLEMGIVGKEMKCFIDTRHTKPGELTAYCQGIHKTAFCRLLDHRDGTFTLFIKPEESGRHLLTIKYDGENVPGSPYTVRVSGPPDAREY
jgi:filamin